MAGVRYATTSDMLAWFGAAELALAAPDDVTPPEAALLRLTIEGGNRSAYPSEAQAAADIVLARIQVALEQASRQADGYLTGRVSLPVAADVLASSILPRQVGAIARWVLADDHPGEAITAGYDRAVAWLRDVAAGRVVLAPDLPAATTAGLPAFEGGRRDWGRR